MQLAQAPEFTVGARVEIHSWSGGHTPQQRLARNGQVGRVFTFSSQNDGAERSVCVRMEKDQKLLRVPAANLRCVAE